MPRPRSIRKEIQFSPSELQVLEKAARNHKKKLAFFVKQAALAYTEKVFILPDEQPFRTFDLRFKEITNAINMIAQFDPPFKKQHAEQIYNLLDILEIAVGELKRPLTLEKIIKKAITERPDLHDLMRKHLLAPKYDSQNL